MKWKEFNEILGESAQFHIPHMSGDIPVEDFIIRKERITRPIMMSRVLISMASLVMVLAFSFYVYMRMTPVSTLTIDINPSMEVQLNVFNRVVNLAGLNAESDDFIAQLNVKNKTVEGLLEQIYEVGIENEYFTPGEAYALIGIYGEESDSERKLLRMIADFTEIHVLTIMQHIDDVPQYSTPEFEDDQTGSIDISDALYDSIESSINDIPDYQDGVTIPNTIYIGSEEYNDYAASLGVSQTRLIIAVEVFNNSSAYTTIDDFNSLLEMDIESLIELHEAIG